MFNSKNKAKQNFILLIKILLAVLSCWYICSKILEEQSNFEAAFQNLLNLNSWFIVCGLTVVVLLSIFNWFFETLKWKNLVSEIKTISIKTAAYQSLIAHSVAVFTPNRIGDFGIKILFFKAQQHKRVLGLNFMNNMFQLAVTVFFGILGCLLLSHLALEILSFIHFNLLLCLGGVALIAFLIVSYFYKHLLQAILVNLQLQFQNKIKVFAYSFLRYFVFSHQYVLLGWILGWNIDYATAMPIIFMLYFVASFLPSIFILDSALKAGIGVYLFSLVGVSSFVIVAISSFMWLLNFAFPAIVGNVLLLQLKLNLVSEKPKIQTS